MGNLQDQEELPAPAEGRRETIDLKNIRITVRDQQEASEIIQQFEDNYEQWKKSYDRLDKAKQEEHLAAFKEISHELAAAFDDLE